MIRNPSWTAEGLIDCEIEHPAFGWLPFTASPDDPEPHGRDTYAAALLMDPSPYVEPPLAPAMVPQSISRFQGRTALKRAGLFQSVEAAIYQADEFTQDAWADAIEWRRGSAMIATLGGALGLTGEEIDELFINAASIEA